MTVAIVDLSVGPSRLERIGRPTTAQSLAADRDGLVGKLSEYYRSCDQTPASLIALEQVYFDLQRRHAFNNTGFHTRPSFEVAMAVYFGAVAVGEGKAVWGVEKREDGPQLALEWSDGRAKLIGLDLLCQDWFKRPANTRRRALYDLYMRYWPSAGTGKLPVATPAKKPKPAKAKPAKAKPKPKPAKAKAKPAPAIDVSLAGIEPVLQRSMMDYVEVVHKPTKKPMPLWASKACDGRPYLPRDAKWPGTAKRALLPVLQIDFADVPALPGFPKSGLLSLWWSDDHVETRLFYYPEIVRDESKLHTEFPQVDDDDMLYPYLEPVKLAFAKRRGSVPFGDYRFEEIFGRAFVNAFWDSPNQNKMWDRIWKLSGGSDSRIGGYANPQQEDPRKRGAARKYEVQLLQLQNDNFTHNFFITPADLKRRDFSDVLDYSACD